VLSNSVAAPRFSALLFGSLATIALVLAIAGIYGLVSYIVEMRTHEFGIRLALGAEANHIIKLVLKRGLLLGVAGSVIGLASAQAFSRLLSSLLFGITATDVITMISVCGLLLLVTLVACYIPAIRAGRITPIEAIRADR
jgi:ABC-type antimicrobial peptide transport system permease subunit